MYLISFTNATVSRCDHIGRTVNGVCAIVTKGGVEVFRSTARSKRAPCRKEAESWLLTQIDNDLATIKHLQERIDANLSKIDGTLASIDVLP